MTTRNLKPQGFISSLGRTDELPKGFNSISRLSVQFSHLNTLTFDCSAFYAMTSLLILKKTIIIDWEYVLVTRLILSSPIFFKLKCLVKSMYRPEPHPPTSLKPPNHRHHPLFSARFPPNPRFYQPQGQYVVTLCQACL